MGRGKETVRVAAMSDLHYSTTSHSMFKSLFNEIAERADVLALCGDLTDYGLPEEAENLAQDLSGISIPVLAVLGNHDYEADQVDAVRTILNDAGVTVLDGDTCELHGIGFAGIKGFGGGFGRGTLGYWGEPAIKQFVQEALDEALKLESALARLRTPQRVALLHYSPIQATVAGEPPEIFPWLGCSRLEEPFSRYPVAAIFHGHAHNGAPEGATIGGVPVYNVAVSLLKKTYPDQPPYHLLELPVDPSTK